MVAEEGCEDSVAGDWGSASLDMSQDYIAGFDFGSFFDFVCEPFTYAAEAYGVWA